ncbi:MAG: hypothetical protein ACD_51C00252G0007 [uncultured bacterium]|nr:MAG: hypothetical protein ACD_51C00252G0007 [uncultured bacterium]
MICFVLIHPSYCKSDLQWVDIEDVSWVKWRYGGFGADL